MSHSPELFGMLAIFALLGTVIVIVMWIITSRATGFDDRLAEPHTPRSQGKWFCRYCGRDIDASSAFCCYCGCDLDWFQSRVLDDEMRN